MVLKMLLSDNFWKFLCNVPEKIAKGFVKLYIFRMAEIKANRRYGNIIGKLSAKRSS